jgi:hypothetical protein
VILYRRGMSRVVFAIYRGGRFRHWVKVKNRQHPAFAHVQDQFYAELRRLTNGLASRTNVCPRRKRTCGKGSPGLDPNDTWTHLCDFVREELAQPFVMDLLLTYLKASSWFTHTVRA